MCIQPPSLLTEHCVATVEKHTFGQLTNYLRRIQLFTLIPVDTLLFRKHMYSFMSDVNRLMDRIVELMIREDVYGDHWRKKDGLKSQSMSRYDADGDTFSEALSRLQSQGKVIKYGDNGYTLNDQHPDIDCRKPDSERTTQTEDGEELSIDAPGQKSDEELSMEELRELGSQSF